MERKLILLMIIAFTSFLVDVVEANEYDRRFLQFGECAEAIGENPSEWDDVVESKMDMFFKRGKSRCDVDYGAIKGRRHETLLLAQSKEGSGALGVSEKNIMPSNSDDQKPASIQENPAITAKPLTYLVQSRDYLSKIGKKLSVDWKVLAERNNLEPPYRIWDRQRLVYYESDIKPVSLKKEEKKSENSKPDHPASIAQAEKEGDELWKGEALRPRKEYPDDGYSGEMKSLRPEEKKTKKARKQNVASSGKEIEKSRKKSEDYKVRDVYRDLLCDQGRFERVLGQLGLSSIEKDELRKRITSGDFHWGLAKKGDRFDFGLNRNDVILPNPEVDWSLQKTDLAAADVYRLSSGKEIWIFLKGGNVYVLKKKNSKGPVSMSPPFKEKSSDRMVVELKARSTILPKTEMESLDDRQGSSDAKPNKLTPKIPDEPIMTPINEKNLGVPIRPLSALTPKVSNGPVAVSPGRVE
ncbi:MAG: hypothetical protein ACD_15C00193G0012 [uncultured bacterium]|nr:MAG: hypothetical protein ACD_15C00193G0012 [uncultured bacterium]HCU70984.1 hypothetical protein [Candidatus Moranbacteria bacterium]